MDRLMLGFICSISRMSSMSSKISVSLLICCGLLNFDVSRPSSPYEIMSLSCSLLDSDVLQYDERLEVDACCVTAMMCPCCTGTST